MGDKSFEDELYGLYAKRGLHAEGREAVAREFLKRKVRGETEITDIRLTREGGKTVAKCYDEWGRTQTIPLPTQLEGADIRQVAESLAKAAKTDGREIEQFEHGPFNNQFELSLKKKPT